MVRDRTRLIRSSTHCCKTESTQIFMSYASRKSFVLSLTDTNKATGAQYTPNPEYQVDLNLTMRPKTVVRARKMVILSAGACGTLLCSKDQALATQKS